MATSTGIVLAATAIGGFNEWYQTDEIPWRIGVAGLALSLFLGGAEKINQPLAVGFSTIMLVTVLVSPIKGKSSPLQTAANIFGGGKK